MKAQTEFLALNRPRPRKSTASRYWAAWMIIASLASWAIVLGAARLIVTVG